MSANVAMDKISAAAAAARRRRRKALVSRQTLLKNRQVCDLELNEVVPQNCPLPCPSGCFRQVLYPASHSRCCSVGNFPGGVWNGPRDCVTLDCTFSLAVFTFVETLED